MDSAAALWGTRVAEATVLPDERLDKRFASLLCDFASNPLASIPQACGDWASTKATYRFLENRRVLDSDLLQGIARHTARQAVLLPEILVVQDSSSLNFTRLHAIPQLGPIDSAGLARGLLFHTSLALDTKGKILGLLDLQCWTRPQTGQPKPQEKESGKWLHGIDRSRQVLGESAPGGILPRLIHVMDREGDCFEVMLAVVDAGDSAVIRCAQNRRVEGSQGKAHDEVRAQPLLGELSIDVPRSQGKKARRAAIEVRSLAATLIPDLAKYPHGWEMTWNLVEVWERYPPPGEEAVHWLLWTREPAETIEQALEVVAKYTCRWPIETYQPDYTPSERWARPQCFPYHQRNRAARTGDLVPATAHLTRWRNRMSDPTSVPRPNYPSAMAPAVAWTRLPADTQRQLRQLLGQLLTRLLDDRRSKEVCHD